MKQRKKISKCISLLLSSLLFFSLSLSAQEKKKIRFKRDIKPEKVVVDSVATTELYQGLFVGIDLYGLGNKIFGGDYISSEVAIEVNLKNRFFPILEIGYGTSNFTDETTQIYYQTKAPFARIGLNYNFQYKKKNPSYLYLGFRYGFTSFSYDLSSPNIEDEIWNTETTYAHTGLQSNAHWIAFVAGIKVQVYNQFFMGWALRYKSLLRVKDNIQGSPYYIPGFGTNNGSTLGISYQLIYQF